MGWDREPRGPGSRRQAAMVERWLVGSMIVYGAAMTIWAAVDVVLAFMG